MIKRPTARATLNDVVGITICDFELWPDNGARAIPMLSRWCMTEQQTGAKELGQIRIVFLELPNAPCAAHAGRRRRTWRGLSLSPSRSL